MPDTPDTITTVPSTPAPTIVPSVPVTPAPEPVTQSVPSVTPSPTPVQATQTTTAHSGLHVTRVVIICLAAVNVVLLGYIGVMLLMNK